MTPLKHNWRVKIKAHESITDSSLSMDVSDEEKEDELSEESSYENEKERIRVL